MFEQPEVWFPLVATCLARRVQKLFIVGRQRARAQKNREKIQQIRDQLSFWISRLSQTCTPPWAVTSPRETRRSRTFSNDEDDGGINLGFWEAGHIPLPTEHETKNWIGVLLTISRNLSNASDFSWHWILLKRTFSRFKNRKERSSLYVHILQKTLP